MLDHQILTTFVMACVALLVLALGYGIKNWIASLQGTMGDLSANINRLTQVVSHLEKEQAVQRILIQQNGREVRKLQNSVCTQVDCPVRGKEVHLHQRVEDIQAQMDEITDAGVFDVGEGFNG